MNSERFSQADLRLTIALAAIVALCSVYIRLEYDKAFPQASIKLVLSKTEVTDVARKLLDRRGLKTAGFRQLTIFDPDDDARLYLERELGLERANQLMQREVSIWRWRARWFRPPEQEEMLVYISPGGRITGLEHIVPEAAPGAHLSHDQALQLAQDFVRTMSTAPMHIVEDRLEQKPNRNDYLFTWEQDGFRAKDATYRRTVLVQGGAIGHYLEFLYVPESWRREFAGMRSRNELYASIAEACWLPLILAALFLLIRGLRRRTIPWRPLVMISGVVGALMILSQLDGIPLLADRFPTSSPYLQTLLLIVLEALGAGVGVFFYVIVAAAAGEPVYRQSTQDPLSLQTAFTPRGLASRRFYRSVIVGYAFAAVHIAFLVAFYIIGRRFGVWSPQDVQYSDLLSTALPWIYPVAIASMAATSEEFWFRLLAIPLLARLLRVRWIAVILPAFVWGFLHANYPQQPAWIRGVEVGLIGVAAGFILLRFGILATLIWHYTVDAVLIGSFLFDAPSLFYRLNGLFLGLAVLAPLIVSVVLYRRNRGFIVLEQPVSTVEEVTVAVPEGEEPIEPPRPIWNARWLYLAAAIAGVSGLFLAPHTFGDWIRVRLDRTTAEAIAKRDVPDSNQWRTSTDFIANLDVAEFEYLRRNTGAEAADRTVRERKRTAAWRTRFYRPLEKEEWWVYVDQGGNVIRHDHFLDERAPGDRLTAEDARRRVESVLPQKGLVLVDSSEERREKRTDWSYVFEDPQFRVGDARARVSVELHGSEISNLRRFLKLPEDWLRDFQKPTLRIFLIPAMIGSLAMPLLIILLRRLGSHETVFHWLAYSLAGGAALLLAAIASLNQLSTAMMGYDTSSPEQNYVAQYFIGRLVLVTLTGAGIFGLVLALDVFRQAAVGGAPLTPVSLTRAVAAAALVAGSARVLAWAIDRIPGPRPSLPVWSVDGFGSYLPGMRAITHGYLAGVMAVCCAGIVVFGVARYLGLRQRIISATILVVAVALSRSLTITEFAAHGVAVLTWIGVVVLIVRTCSADLIGLGTAAFWLVALDGGYELIQQPNVVLRWNGVVSVVIALAGGLAVFLWGQGRLRFR
jgi:membrane protease YdiL (CAAX protease family)